MRVSFRRKKSPSSEKKPTLPSRVAGRRAQVSAPVRPRLTQQSTETQLSAAWRRLGLLVFAVGVFGGVLGYAFLMSPLTEVTQIDIEGGDVNLQEEVRTAIDTTLQESWRPGFSKRNFFLFPNDELAALIKERFPHVQALSFEKHFPQTVELTLETRDRVVVVCSGGPCFAVDGEGMILSNEDALDDSWQKTRLIDTSGMPFTASDRVIAPEFESFLEQFPDQLVSRLGITITGDLETSSRFSGTVSMATSEGWRLLVDSHAGDEHLFSALQAFFGKQIKTGNDRARLEYVDARANDRIFYRLQGDEAMTQDMITPAPPPTPTTPEKPKKK